MIIVFCLPYAGLRNQGYGNIDGFKKWLGGRRPVELSLLSKVLLVWPIFSGTISLLLIRGRDDLIRTYWSPTEAVAAILQGVALGIAFCNAPIRWVLFSALPAILFQLYFYWMDRYYVFAPMWSSIATYLGAYLALILVPAYVTAKLRYKPRSRRLLRSAHEQATHRIAVALPLRQYRRAVVVPAARLLHCSLQQGKCGHPQNQGKP
ncbi:hypothetical protein ACR8BS_23095 [Ralstonia solanacearum]|uniref:hypothetical protein n=1 Tax=Ralstonia solanacearum TaxID=305 RepID=UPI0030A0593F